MSDARDPAAHAADDAFAAVVAGARGEFVALARAAVGVAERAAESLHGATDAPAALAELRQELHRLNGSAATFGFARLGRIAAALESTVRGWEGNRALDADRRAAIVGRVARTMALELSAADPAAPHGIPPRRLFLVGLRDLVAVPLTAEASARGFAVERLDTTELDDALADGVPFGAILATDAAVPRALSRAACVVLAPAGDADRDGARLIRRAPGDAPSAVLDAILPGTGDPRATHGTALIVDDDPVLRRLVAFACESAHLRVVETADPAAFRAALAQAIPDIVVADINLGASSGLALVEEAIRGRTGPRPATLVLSGHRDDETRRAVERAGADAYVTKPVDLALLTERIADLVGRARHD